jgi:hypothetical protein
MDKFEQRLFQTIVLLKRQFEMIERIKIAIKTQQNDIENSIGNDAQTIEQVYNIYISVFSVIDHLVRYQKIAHVLPRFNQKDNEFIEFNNGMGDLKDIRNQIQHINNEIENQFEGPLLGAICWIKGNAQYITSFHDLGRERSTPGIILNTTTGKYLNEFCFIYNGIYHDLGKALISCVQFNAYVDNRVKIGVNGKEFSSKDHFAAVRFEFKNA